MFMLMAIINSIRHTTPHKYKLQKWLIKIPASLRRKLQLLFSLAAVNKNLTLLRSLLFLGTLMKEGLKKIHCFVN